MKESKKELDGVCWDCVYISMLVINSNRLKNLIRIDVKNNVQGIVVGEIANAVTPDE